ncbi:hypothetical protein, partial [Bradyrhizobium sp.]|uniref:hypothetical protein n=1 Tax=Bradyrhizobium sp. TaxID=376 RepID=UPI003C3452E8
LRYFTLGLDFDLTTFDLYAEIGASDRIVCAVIEGLERSLQEYGLKSGETHVLLTDKLRPALMKNPEQIDVIQKRLRKTAEDIELSRGDTAKKQQLLDVADRVRGEVAERANLSDTRESSIEADRIANVVQNWLVATMLLGAGAEHLSAEMKQMLASLLVQVSSLIAHRTTEAILKVDFSLIKAHFQADPEVMEALKDVSEPNDEVAIERLLGGLVDVLQYSLYAAGFRRVLGQLCEGARQRVLATSVEKAVVSGPIELLIHSAWLADIESKRGRDLLVRTIKDLPATPFLRTCLAAHFLERVYWNHWRKEDRIVLLNAAEECLKGVGLNLNKGELKRYIENSIETKKGQDS